MAKFQVTTETIRWLEDDPNALPARVEIRLWQGNHYPSVPEMREVFGSQPTMDELKAHDPSIDYTRFLDEWAPNRLGVRVPEGVSRNYSSHNYLKRRQRLGWKVLGEIQASDLLTADDSELPLRPFWGDAQVDTSDMTTGRALATEIMDGAFTTRARLALGGAVLLVASSVGGTIAIEHFGH